MVGVGGRWRALVGAPPPFTPEKTALHTKSSQTAGAGAGGCATPVHPRKDGTSHQICSNGRFGSDLV
nr:hypothetical protein [Corynebacterium diphtheriae]